MSNHTAFSAGDNAVTGGHQATDEQQSAQAAAPHVVSQEMLRTLQQLQAELACWHELVEAEKGLRNEVIELLKAGAHVQPGPLRAWLGRTESRTFSASKLARLLGFSRVAELRAAIEPTINYRLWIE